MTTKPIVYSLATAREAVAEAPIYTLGCLLAYARQCGHGALEKHFDLQKVRIVTQDQLDRAASELAADNPLIVVLSSYIWNHHLNLELAAHIRALHPEALIVIGGPSIPKREAACQVFLQANPWIDICCRGEGEFTFSEILDAIRQRPDKALRAVDFSAIPGLMYFDAQKAWVRTAERERTRDLDQLPSPYLSGELDHIYTLGFDFIAIETNRGCPYGCTFCDWGSAILQKVSKFSDTRVYGEIDYAARHRVNTVAVCDANYGMFERDVAFTQYVADTKEAHGYPQVFWTNFAKNASPKIADITRILNHSGLMKTGIIAIQTTDEDVLAAIDRSNIKTAKYDQLLEIYHRERLPVASDLMIGLPGQTYDSYLKDIQFFFDRKVAANTFRTMALPNAPISDPEYMARHALTIDDDGFIASSRSFTKSDLDAMYHFNLAYELLTKQSVLRYILYYLQLEYGVLATRFINEWIRESENSPSLYPLSCFARQRLLRLSPGFVGLTMMTWNNEDGQHFFGQLPAFYQEVRQLAERRFFLRLPESEFQALQDTQEAVMPQLGKRFPLNVALAHDALAYFEQIRPLVNIRQLPAGFRHLGQFPSTTFTVPNQKRRKTMAFQTAGRENGWELESALRFF